jgi:hypothetical protein
LSHSYLALTIRFPAWIDWGHLCLSLADISKKAVDSKRKMNIQYMAQATACFLEAVRLDTSEQSRENIPHCLSMLSHDSSQFGYMFKAFEGMLICRSPK